MTQRLHTNNHIYTVVVGQFQTNNIAIVNSWRHHSLSVLNTLNCLTLNWTQTFSPPDVRELTLFISDGQTFAQPLQFINDLKAGGELDRCCIDSIIRFLSSAIFLMASCILPGLLEFVYCDWVNAWRRQAGGRRSRQFGIEDRLHTDNKLSTC